MPEVKNRKKRVEMAPSFYSNRTEVWFEGHAFFAPQGYETALQWAYGDYMTLPSESQRVGHHIATTVDFGDALV